MLKHKTKKGMVGIAAACTLVAALCAFASGDHAIATESLSTPSYLSQEATSIDVTVTDEAVFNILQEDSNEATVSDLVVKNNLNSAPIEVSNIRATAEAGYNLEAFNTDFSTFRADSKHFGMAYTTNGLDAEDISGTGLNIEKVILGQVEERFRFKGKSSVYSSSVNFWDYVHMANIVFTIGFTDSDFIPDQFTDLRDGKKYTTTKIGSATWMTQNLSYVPEGATWEDDGIYVAESGEVYYSQTAAKNGGVCPQGWSLPIKKDFESLVSRYDDDTIVSKPFNGSLAGFFYDDSLEDVGADGYYWSATEGYEGDTYFFHIGGEDGMFIFSTDETLGGSVRCMTYSH